MYWMYWMYYIVSKKRLSLMLTCLHNIHIDVTYDIIYIHVH